MHSINFTFTCRIRRKDPSTQTGSNAFNTSIVSLFVCENLNNWDRYLSLIIFSLSFSVVCFLAYFGISAVVTLMVPYYALDAGAALPKAFEQNGAHQAKYIISVGAIMGLTGTTLTSLMPMPRLLYSMAQDGLVFKFLSRVNAKTEVPVIATIISGALTGNVRSCNFHFFLNQFLYLVKNT